MTFPITFFIERVRDGQPLKSSEISSFIEQLDTFPDEQVAAFLAHAYHKTLGKDATVALTMAMRDSGTKLSWSGMSKPIVDKHSTGGVGDKVSLCLAPILAALGMAIPMVSGRGLGATGGTLDKLEAIPGFSTALSIEKLVAQVRKIGLAFGQQTEDFTPADRRLYAIRDITGTVESIELITASILSKKLAESPHALVFDVKWGTGAFMHTLERAKLLAQTLVEVSKGAGVKARALLTNMNQPLGWVSGHTCEVAEAVKILKNESAPRDTFELTVDLAIQLVLMTGVEQDIEQARTKVHSILKSGKPFELWCNVIAAQGGDPKIFERDFPLIPPTKKSYELKAKRDGWIGSINARSLGQCLILAKAGRMKKSDRIDTSVTLHHILKSGDQVKTGEVVARLTYNDSTHESEMIQRLTDAFIISEKKTSAFPLVQEVIT